MPKYNAGHIVRIKRNKHYLEGLEVDLEMTWQEHAISQKDYDLVLDAIRKNGEWEITSIQDMPSGPEYELRVKGTQADGPWMVEECQLE